MVYNQTLTIWALPPQPLLPVNDIRDPIVVTIWLVVCFIAAFYLRNLLKRTKNPTWKEFRAIRYGTLCLAIWYLARATDRWLRYDQRTAIPYGYALAEPVYEILRVTSTILILWGTYTVVWRELEDQFSPRQQGIWWFAARFLLFIVTLMAIFYIVLGIALVAVWLEFLSLNAIADIAGKRNDFEMAMTAFFFLFALLTLVEATVAWFHAFRIHGQVQRTRLFMWLGALFLFVRSTSELVIVNDLYKFHATRQNMKFTSDVSYGFITMLYLAMMCAMAHIAASSFDSGGRQANMVASDVRRYIIDMLEAITNGGRREPPPFETIFREVEMNLESALSRGPLTGTLDMDRTYKEAAALDCIEQLRTEFRTFALQPGPHSAPRPSSILSILTSLCGRRSRQTMGNTPTTALSTNTNRPKPSSTSVFSESTARSRPVPEQPRGYRPTPSLYSEVSNEPTAAIPLLGNPIPATSTRPWPTSESNVPPRWAPSLDAFQEQPQPYQDIPPLPLPYDIPPSSSPGPPPPPVRRPVSTPAPPLVPTNQSIYLPHVEQSLPSSLPPPEVPPQPYTMDSNNSTSQPPTISLTSAKAHDAPLPAIPQQQDLAPSASIIPPASAVSEPAPSAHTSSDTTLTRPPLLPPQHMRRSMYPPPPPPDSSSSSPNQTSTSPQATPGSSYNSMRARRLARMAGISDSDPSSSTSGSRTGYQIQPGTHTSSALSEPGPSTPVDVQPPTSQPRRKIFTPASFDGAGWDDSVHHMARTY